MTITKMNVKFPKAPIVERIILRRTRIVIHDCASFKTLNCEEIKSVKWD